MDSSIVTELYDVAIEDIPFIASELTAVKFATIFGDHFRCQVMLITDEVVKVQELPTAVAYRHTVILSQVAPFLHIT